ncbi:uncharacterized protein [Branchiostoma lanceolatum]|uniref:uncharacterized protein n=1 Tax=Branchiostoma lanceolatum TaxID=7740 RepID=UPI003453EF17
MQSRDLAKYICSVIHPISPIILTWDRIFILPRDVSLVLTRTSLQKRCDCQAVDITTFDSGNLTITPRNRCMNRGPEKLSTRPTTFQAMTVPTWKIIPIILLVLWTTATFSGGAPTFIQYPPAKVEGSQGDNILLSFAANGTEEDGLIIIQGPNHPINDSKKQRIIFEQGTGQEKLLEPFKSNFSVITGWSGGVTLVNLTILDLQPGDEGAYQLSVSLIHRGPDVYVTINELNSPDDGVTVNTTVTPRTTSGSNVNTTERAGSTSGGGLPSWAIALIVLVVLAIIIAIVVFVYKRRNSGPPPQAHPRYDPVNNRDQDRHGNGVIQPAQELNGVGSHGRENGAEEVPLDNIV